MIDSVYIGNVKIDFPVGLAPMAGVTDMTFRCLCREQGAGLLCTEMVSAKALIYKNPNTKALLEHRDCEHPIAVQLFGSDPDAVAEGARMIEELPFDIVDFNMGCPVPKVVRNGEGSALMKDPQQARKVLEALVNATKKPVTVKIRSGFDSSCINAEEIAKTAEDAGVSAIAVHARTREQFYSGQADWNVISNVKKAVAIPVFGNGDITDGPSAVRMIEQTGCDGILIGRAAKGNPWVFSEVCSYIQEGTIPERPSEEEVRKMIIRHATELTEDKGEFTAIREMRSHAAWYTAGMRNSSSLRRALNQVTTLEGLKELMTPRD